MATELFETYHKEIFKKYKTEDFVLDRSFVKMVKAKPESSQFIEKFIEKYPEKKEEIFLAIEILKELQKAEKHQQFNERKLEIWERIIKKNKRQLSLKYFRYAAAFLMIIGLGSASVHYLHRKPSSEYFISSMDKSINYVSLILSDGKKFVIHNTQPEVLYNVDGKSILVNDTIILEQPVSKEGINQIITPYGRRSRVLLSDGTKVWLNSGSRLVYSPGSKGKIREVFLEGEAYFDVAKDADRPFYVKTDAYNIKVFGTKFDVIACKQDNQFNTVLIEGKVSLNVNGQPFPKEVFLSPNQKASFSEGNKNFQITEVDNIENYIAWIGGYLFFDKEDITDVIKKVSRYYNITIDLMLPGDRAKLSGKLDLKDDPEKVLKDLAIISNAKILKQENKYLFMSK